MTSTSRSRLRLLHATPQTSLRGIWYRVDNKFTPVSLLMTKMEPPKEVAGADVKDLVFASLRQKYPWMKIEAIEEMAAGCLEVVTHGVEKQ